MTGHMGVHADPTNHEGPSSLFMSAVTSRPLGSTQALVIGMRIVCPRGGHDVPRCV
jgi:hypothetical protein